MILDIDLNAFRVSYVLTKLCHVWPEGFINHAPSVIVQVSTLVTNNYRENITHFVNR